ncbi:YpbS family protein [Bacillus amyloliquefaciens]|uniref:YpbS family protein n=1 Tax=Bacillus amyloliquefaciens TaxID=1390 RepID=UPI0022B03FB1|nr:YpbS family protein [Bacillus amyloliquefaciens]MCZ4249020.1 YpbS family protein [Bacillus amyloliquefaciens]
MSEVHKAISAHSAKQHHHVKSFVELEYQREQAIEAAVLKCRQNEPFTTDAINEITAKMNQLAKKGVVPARRFVTEEMVKEFVSRQ